MIGLRNKINSHLNAATIGNLLLLFILFIYTSTQFCQNSIKKTLSKLHFDKQ